MLKLLKFIHHKNKLKQHEEICNNHDSCHVKIPKWIEEILKYNSGGKLLKAPFAIYLDLECLLKKEQCLENNDNNNNNNNNKNNNNLGKSYTEKKATYEPSGWAMFIKCSFEGKENKFDYYKGKGGIEKFCEKLKERAMKIIYYEKK